jgi:glycosyltransferase involved in cell wall biosynthesis
MRLAKRTCDEINIEVIYNGINPDRYRSVLIEEPDSDTNIVFVGRLIKRKGVEYLLKAFREICDEYENCKLTIAGDGPERTRLENFCRQSGIESKASFLGMVPQKDIATVYKKADIFVLPSLEEALGNVTHEAIASGLPIITTNTGAAELIDGNGFIVEKGDHTQIKRAIMEYLENPELMRIHSQRSRELADEMRWDDAARAYLEIYNSIK